MVANLLLVLISRMEDNVRNQLEQDMLEVFHSHSKVGPVMSPFQNIENVTYTGEVHVRVRNE